MESKHFDISMAVGFMIAGVTVISISRDAVGVLIGLFSISVGTLTLLDLYIKGMLPGQGGDPDQ